MRDPKETAIAYIMRSEYGVKARNSIREARRSLRAATRRKLSEAKNRLLLRAGVTHVEP